MRKLFFIIIAVFLVIPNAEARDSKGKADCFFTSNIVNKKPIDKITSVKVGEQISFFTDIKNMEGQTVKHSWKQEGEEIFSMDFAVGGSNWRVWTTKNIYNWNVGDIDVTLTGSDGKILSQKTITVIE